MAKFSTSITFANGDQVTSGKLNEIITGLEAGADLVADSTLVVVAGTLKVGIVTASNMGVNSVPTAAVQDFAITTGKVAFGAIGANQLGEFSVGITKIAPQCITFDKFFPGIFATKANMEAELASRIVTADQAKNGLSAVKCYGEFAITSSARAIKTNSYNVLSVVRISATQTQVNIDTDMNSAEYTVTTSGGSDGTEIVQACYYDKAAGNFKIRHTTEGAGRLIAFTVHGKLT